MPTLFRLISFLAVIALIVFGGMLALATFVKPTQTEMTIRVSTDKLNPVAPTAPAVTP